MGNKSRRVLPLIVIFSALALKATVPDLAFATPPPTEQKVFLDTADLKTGENSQARLFFKKIFPGAGPKTDSLGLFLQTNPTRGRFYLARSSRLSENRQKAKTSPAFASQKNKKTSGGLSVGTVKKGHLLQKLGLKTGDVIKKINNQKVSSKKSFFALLKRSRFGEKNPLEIERKGKKRTLYYIVEVRGGPVFRRTYRAVPRTGGGRLKYAHSRRRGKKPAVKRRKSRPARTLSSKAGERDLTLKNGKSALLKNPSSKNPGVKEEGAGLSKRKKAGDIFPQKQGEKTPKGQKNSSNEEVAGTSSSRKATPSFDRLSKKEKSLLTGKSKYLQKGYVLQMNSKIYREPNFDAPHIYTVPAGGKILISRKIFTPPSQFGTFYKIFIHKNKKVVGYISEIDVTPRFERSGKNKINPRYAILKSQMSKGRRPGKETLLQPEKWPDPEPLKPPKQKKGDRFAGLSLLVKWDGNRNLQSFFGGVKFSGQGVLSTALNMDINFMSDMRRENFRFDIAGIYTLLKGRGGGSLYLGGGMEMSLERATGTIFPGLLGSAGVRMTLLTGIFWQNEFRASWTFDLSKKAAEDSYGFLTSLQFRF